MTILHRLLYLGVAATLWSTLRIVALTARLTVPGAQNALGELTYFALGK